MSSETCPRSKKFREMSHESKSGQDRKLFNRKHNVHSPSSSIPGPPSTIRERADGCTYSCVSRNNLPVDLPVSGSTWQ